VDPTASGIWGIYGGAESVEATGSLTQAPCRVILPNVNSERILHSIERPAGDAPSRASLTSVHAPLPDFTPRRGAMVTTDYDYCSHGVPWERACAACEAENVARVEAEEQAAQGEEKS
jgi:hypothetical protein